MFIFKKPLSDPVLKAPVLQKRLNLQALTNTYALCSTSNLLWVRGLCCMYVLNIGRTEEDIARQWRGEGRRPWKLSAKIQKPQRTDWLTKGRQRRCLKVGGRTKRRMARRPQLHLLKGRHIHLHLFLLSEGVVIGPTNIFLRRGWAKRPKSVLSKNDSILFEI